MLCCCFVFCVCFVCCFGWRSYGCRTQTMRGKNPTVNGNFKKKSPPVDNRARKAEGEGCNRIPDRPRAHDFQRRPVRLAARGSRCRRIVEGRERGEAAPANRPIDYIDDIDDPRTEGRRQRVRLESGTPEDARNAEGEGCALRRRVVDVVDVVGSSKADQGAAGRAAGRYACFPVQMRNCSGLRPKWRIRRIGTPVSCRNPAFVPRERSARTSPFGPR